MDGCVLHELSEEAKNQIAAEERKKEEAEEMRKLAIEAAEEEAAEGEEINPDEIELEDAKNQFNFSDRAAQTFNGVMKEKRVETKPPAVENFTGTLTQWDIFDYYMADAARFGDNGGVTSSDDGSKPAEKKGLEDDVVHSAPMGKSLKMLERMVNQNREDEIYQDFKYWEDASDEFRDGEGSLLPLWRFSSERSKRKQVTAIAWHPAFPDLFAVGFGSYDFMHQSGGLVYCYSLKNTSHPEYTFSMDSGVMCLDFHPQHHTLLAVGCYNGNVRIYDIRKTKNQPIYVSNIKTGKHTDPVWQVKWQEEEVGGDFNFFSISSDGHVASWFLTNTELKMEPMMALKLVSTPKDGVEDEATLTGLASGCCFDFNKTSEHLFVVGTEEGKIHKCSKAYSGQYLETYEGHHMAVYAVKWNPYHEDIFLSCSADWTVKLWDHNLPYPLMSFDLNESVGDISWSPYSSTTFAAVTSDGKVHVFDLNVNKHEALCEQKLVKRNKLTHVAFNTKEPVLLVGDDRGGVMSLKLSPNLRIHCEAETPVKDDEEAEEGAEPVILKSARELEYEKMVTLLEGLDTKMEG